MPPLPARPINQPIDARIDQCKGKHVLAALGEHNMRAILVDTQGPEIRTGNLEDGGKIALVKGSTIELTTDPVRRAPRFGVAPFPTPPPSFSHRAVTDQEGTQHLHFLRVRNPTLSEYGPQLS